MNQTFIEKYDLEECIYDKTERSSINSLDQLSLPSNLSCVEDYYIKILRGNLRDNAGKFYPEIDLSFLTMRNDHLAVEYSDITLPNPPRRFLRDLPRFAVYSLNCPEFRIRALHYMKEVSIFKPNFLEDVLGKKEWNFNQGLDAWGYITGRVSSQSEIHRAWTEHYKLFEKEIRQPLLKGIKFSNEIPDTNIEIKDVKGVNIMISHYFPGFMPETTKQKLTTALKIFDRSEIYLVGEANDWLSRPIPADPLMIGLCKEKTYLIDQFDTTPIERYVASEFII